MKNYLLIGTLFYVLMISACSTKKEESELTDVDPDNGKEQTANLELPDGFSAIVVADTLGKARHIAVNDNGDLYAKMKTVKDGEHGILAMRDTDGDGVIDERHGFADYGGTGLRLYNGYLYASSDSAVYRYPLDKDGWLPSGEGETIVSHFPNQGQHDSKSITFDGDGNIYVNIGAPSNACMEKMRTKDSPGMDPCPLLEKHAGIWQYDADTPGQHAYDDGYRYTTGIRNTVALDWNFQDNQLYALQHGRDQLHQLFPDQYSIEESAELPSEEFLRVTKDSNFGWPYCYYDHLKRKKVLGPEYGGDGEEVGRCADMDMPEIGFPGHIAPNDLLFYTGDMFPEKYKNGAFIAFHGSWNRKPKQYGYFIVFAPFLNGRATGDWEIFADGFIGQESIQSPSAADYRPTGLAQGPDGALYISDDSKGRIWKVTYQ